MPTCELAFFENIFEEKSMNKTANKRFMSAIVNTLWIKIALPIVLVCWLLLEVVLQIALNGYIANNQALIAERLRDVATAAAQTISAESHTQAIQGKDSLSQARFKEVVAPLAAMRSRLGYAEHWYTLTASETDTTTFGVMTHPTPFVGDKYIFRDADVAATFHRALREKKAGSTGIYRSDNGVWISGLAPVIDAQGVAVAVLEVDISYKEYLAVENRIRLEAWIVRGVGVVLSLVLGFVLGGWIARPVRALRDAVVQVGETDLTQGKATSIELKRSDEIGELGAAFNTMTARLFTMAGLAEQERRRSIRQSERAAEDARNEVIEQQWYLEREVERISVFLDAVRHNDLSRTLKVTKDDAVGQLVVALNQAIDEQRRTIVQMQDAAASLAAVSQQIAVNADNISAQSADQAVRVREIALAIDEMSKTIGETAANIATTSDVSSEVVSSAKTGQDAVRKTLDGMTTIASVVESMASVMTKLSNSSSQIGAIVETIEEIADQTNLLALNAAIEAARAGEAGKGFAVVADEVRKLAEKTTKATKEITRTIGVIQQDTQQASEAAQTGANKVREGTALAQDAQNRLTAIVKGIEHVNELIVQIATSSEKQSATASEIAHNVDVIRTAVDANTTDIQGVANSVGNVTQEAEHLRLVAARFVLKNEE